MKIWYRVKLGAIPFVIASILIFLSYELCGILLHWGFHFTGITLFDVPVNFLLLIISCYVFGFLFEHKNFQQFTKNHFPRIPLLGPMLLLLILPRKLELIEIRTVPGVFDGDGSWEYALVTRDPWEENGIVWYRAHTLGLTGRLYVRISESNVRHSKRSDRDIWMTVFSMGLL